MQMNMVHWSNDTDMVKLNKKAKGTPQRTRKPRGGWGRGIALHSLDLGSRRAWVVSTTPRPLYSRERPSTHCKGGWVGPRTGLNVCEKSRPLPGFDPRTVRPVAIPTELPWSAVKLNTLRNICPSGTFVHHKSHIDWPGMQRGPPRWEAGS
jgi:hypothetical protein